MPLFGGALLMRVTFTSTLPLTLDTLRNFFLLPMAEVPAVFQMIHVGRSNQRSYSAAIHEIGRGERQLSTMPLDSLGSPWYAGSRLSRRLSIAQV